MEKNLLRKTTHYAKVFLYGSMLQLLLVNVLLAQGVNISGRITSEEDSEGLPGVNVVEKGTTNGVVTDIAGAYSISVSEGSTLIFSSIGFVTEEVIVGNQSVIDLQLAPDITQLEELVVIGYGTQKKSSLTGSVASIGGETLKEVPVATVAESMTGRLAGVQVITTDGEPDAEIQIRVRGGTSLTQDSDPLFIVDGFPVVGIDDLSPSDIESIDVLKDASSTAIYGSRGANGVVIVTTKSGKAGKITVNFNSFYAVKKIAKTMDLLNPGDYARMQYEYAVVDADGDLEDIESYENSFGLFKDLDLYDNQPANDWQMQLYGRTGNTFSNDLSIRGGGEKFNFSANFARFSDRAIMIESDYVRNNLTTKFGIKPNDKINLNFSIRYSDTEITGAGANDQTSLTGGSGTSRINSAISYAPIPISGIGAPDDTDPQGINGNVNPLAVTYDNARERQRKNYNYGGSFSWQIIEKLKATVSLGLDNYSRSENRFFGITTSKSRDKSALAPNQPTTITRDLEEVRTRATTLLDYDILKTDNHNLKILLGNEILHSQTSDLEYEIQGFPVEFTSEEAFKLTTQGLPFSIDNFQGADDNMVSFFTRLNYDFKDRYLLAATFRADGSSRFLGDNVWGYFPSVSAAWKISEESFMQGASNWMNMLKIRASWGVAGNNNIPEGQTRQFFLSYSTANLNNINNYWAPSNVLANPDLVWETTQTKNIGIDFGFLKGRVNGTLEWYDNITDDLLLRDPVSGTGYSYQYANLGKYQNTGFEVTLGLILLDKKDYGLSMDFNVGLNRNEILSLGTQNEITDELVVSRWASTQIAQDFRAAVGSEVGQMWGYESDGRYEVSDFEGYDESSGNWILKEGTPTTDLYDLRPGIMKFKDRNGDGNISLEDQYVIGRANPLSTGGFVLNGYAYGFDLTAAFNWSYGNDIYNANKIEHTTATRAWRNYYNDIRLGERWTDIDWNTGEMITDPDILAATNSNTTLWSPVMPRNYFSDWAVEDGSFLRLNTLSLGYTLPKDWVSKIKLENLRFYVTGYNLFIWTNYSGFDPEVSSLRRSPLIKGVDYSAYPRSRQLTMGLNLTF